MQGSKKTKHMTYNELLELVQQGQYYVYLDGSMPFNKNEIYPSEEEIYYYIKNELENNIKYFRDYQQENNIETGYDRISQYLEKNPWFLNYFEQSINNLDLSLINFNLRIDYGSMLMIVKVNNESIIMQGVDVEFVRKDDFKVNIYDIPIDEFTLEN